MSTFDGNDEVPGWSYEDRRRQIEAGKDRAKAPTPLGVTPILIGAAILAPVLALVYIGSVIGAGAGALAEDSILSPLFPSAGDSATAVMIRTGIVEIIVAGGLVLTGWVIGRTRAAPLAWVAYVAAFVMIPAIAIVAATTSVSSFG